MPHLDVWTAFLSTPMDMDIYTEIPEGFKDAGKDSLLVKAL